MADELDLLPGEAAPEDLDDEPETDGPTGLGVGLLERDLLEIPMDDIEFEGDRAWLVHPANPVAASAGILMCHWYSTEEPFGDRDEFLGEARELAELGATCLLPQGQFPWRQDPTGTGLDREMIEAEVARLSRGLDLLAAQPGVDPGRLALVGHDFGAMHGAVLAARDERVRAVVLMAPAARWADWFIPFWDVQPSRGEYLSLLEEVDPINQLASISPRPVLVQLGNQDKFVPVMAPFEFAKPTAGGGKPGFEVRRYDTSHELEAPETLDDRLAFLREHLGLG